MSATNMIVDERRRQIDDEGWTPEHDDQHRCGEMAVAAACYAAHSARRNFYAGIGEYRKAPPPPDWPWDAQWWKPKNPTRDLIRAAALCAAEIERLERKAAADYAVKVTSDE